MMLLAKLLLGEGVQSEDLRRREFSAKLDTEV